MKTFIILYLLPTAVAADVVVLKSGAKIAGRIADKQDHYEVTSDGALRTYLKDEVDRILTSPKELLGDADAMVEAAKRDYEAALALGGESEQQLRFKEAIAKVARAREAYSGAIELFPEDAGLGAKLMVVMQLMRLCRERLHSEIASGLALPHRRATAPTEPSGALPADESLATLLDPSRRADPARREAAIGAFRTQRANHPESYDLATAAIQFLTRLDRNPKADGTSPGQVQRYFDQGWLRDPAKLTPATHLEAARWLAVQIAALRRSDATAADLLHLFATVHVAHAPPGPETEKTARALGLEVQNGQVGSAEGLAIRDLHDWIAHGDFDLATLAFVREYRSVDTPVVRFVWSYALLRVVQARKRGFDRPAAALETIKTSEVAFRDHVDALERSIKAVAVCNVCGGEGKLRCTNCHGKKELRYTCQKCKGKGFTVNSLGTNISCVPCRGTGVASILKCEKCKDGYFECRQCGGKPRTPPEMSDICDTFPCEECEGRGMLFRRAELPCPSCKGLGLKLTPKSDPARVLK